MAPSMLTRLQFFHDVGYPYEDALLSSSNLTDSVMCSYLSDQNFDKTHGKSLFNYIPYLNIHVCKY